MTVLTTKAGYEIRGGDGLLVAFWRHADLTPAKRLPDGSRRLACRTDPDSCLVMLPGPAAGGKFGRAAAAVLLASAVAAGGLALRNALPAAPPPPPARACGAPAGLAALQMLAGLLASAPSPGHPAPHLVVVDRNDRRADSLPGGTIVLGRPLLADRGDLATALAPLTADPDAAGRATAALTPDQWSALAGICGH